MNVLITFIKTFIAKLKKILNSTQTRNSQKGVERSTATFFRLEEIESRVPETPKRE